ncbi:S9 family peptidase [Rhodanobacter sp. 7MK24]|uniref:S9 family peptidase n=1 Tax=Rhodanobacter sp. 7MK24 TaxID=2775922 RepID=UPI0017827430|nr:S9 family peptidase [Rhodanobacter sp. 7MK24]MBD8879660.1 S9 family peptidase [Rhodanobacter sp. 7MK24]
MKLIVRVTLALCASLVWPSHRAAAADGTRSFQLDDLRKLTRLSEPQISPDGQRIAVIASTPDWASDQRRQQIDLVDTASGAVRVLTWQRKQLSMPRWSPDGSQLAFLAKDAETKQAQIFVLPMDGGDASRITTAAGGVDGYGWSPDGRQIAFVSEDEPAKPASGKPQGDAFRVGDNDFLARSARAPWQLWVVSSQGGEARRLTQGDGSLFTEQQDHAPEPVWTRDGRRIVFTRFPNAYWGSSFKSVVASVAVEGGQPELLAPEEGSMDPAYAPGDDAFAYLRPRQGDRNNGNAVYVAIDGKVNDATQKLARHIEAYAWLPGGHALLLEGDDGTRTSLWEQPLAHPAKKLDLGDTLVHPPLSVSQHGAIAYVGSTATHPDELYVMDSTTARPRRLTDVNAFIDSLTLGRSESVAWTGPDGFPEDGVLTYPVGYAAGKKYPLALVIHGGPQSASNVAFSPLPQLLAARGIAVFQPNYRGSSNLGDAYQHAIFRDTATGPGNDVMAGLAAVEKLGLVDEQHVAVSGWSYGGFMTAWLTSHYGVWKAAVTGAPLTDWVMDYTVSYYQQGDDFYFGGSPWTAQSWDIWREQSPIAYVRNVTAPTLILGDVGDPDVPLVNSYEWYHGLRDNGVPVEFYAYPADTHFPHDIVRTTDVYRRWVDWLVRYLE